MKVSPLPFNLVIVNTALGTRRLTISEFEAMPLTERVRALLEKRVEFYQGQLRVEQTDALRALREQGR
jgi:hypothetical protein